VPGTDYKLISEKDGTIFDKSFADCSPRLHCGEPENIEISNLPYEAILPKEYPRLV